VKMNIKTAPFEGVHQVTPFRVLFDSGFSVVYI
jgi:hypothetical protein